MDIKVTNDVREMIEIGKDLFEINRKVYSDKMISYLKNEIKKSAPKASEQEMEDYFFQSI